MKTLSGKVTKSHRKPTGVRLSRAPDEGHHPANKFRDRLILIPLRGHGTTGGSETAQNPMMEIGSLQIMDFRDIGLSSSLLHSIEAQGFRQTTPIQAASIPPFLAGHDFIGQSKTGSGKTAAFVIPILHKIRINDVQPQALILCPTRELCEQVLQECRKFSKTLKGFKVVGLIGGQSQVAQIEALKQGVHLVVGTPGRTLEHLKLKNLKTGKLKILVLDEADRLLEEGFTEEMAAIIAALPKARQTVFFSATFPPGIKELSQRYQTNAKTIQITEGPSQSLQIQQYLYGAEKPQKLEVLQQILKLHPAKCTLIFCRTKQLVREIGEQLTLAKISTQVLHADLKQNERDQVMKLFRSGGFQILVATDVAARGLDIDRLELVVNVDLPPSPDIYVHRIGRTGRAGKTGTAVSIATAYEAELVAQIETATGVSMIRNAL